ncbi:MAG: hypothetical protein JWO82_2724 [Akkermansiaceae bacterium]|nr:hypothetical protein [Akkermansiaceae bacterium]
MSQTAGTRSEPTPPPGPRNHRTLRIFLLLAGAASLPFAWRLPSKSNPSSAESTPGQNRSNSSSITAAKPPAELVFQAWLKDPSRSNTANLADQLLSHGKLQRTPLTEQIASLYEKNPQAHEAALRALANQLFATDPGGTLGLLARLHASAGIVPLERELMNRWISEADLGQVTASLRQSSREAFASPMVQLAFLSSICQQEQPDQLPKLIGWVNGLNDPKDSSLKISAVESLVETSRTTTFPEISGMLGSQLDDPAMAAWAGRLGAKLIDAQPEEILDWLRNAPASEGKRSMLEDVMGALSNSHPEIAAGLINDPAQLAEIFGTPGDPHLNQMQDRALARYLDATLREAPDNALQVSGMFHDPAQAAAYGEKARQLIAVSSAR